MDDQELIRSILKGSINDYALLIKRYQGKLQSSLSSHCLNRQEIEYYLHEAFVKAYAKLHKFNPEYSFFPWLKTIALNLLRDEIRSRKTLSDDAKESLIANLKSDDESEEELGALKDCLSNLDMAQQDIMKLRYWSKLSIDELSKQIQKKPSAVKMQILRIRESLKRCIKGKISYG